MKQHIKNLVHKHILNVNLNKEYKACKNLSIFANIFLVCLFLAFSYYTFFQYSKLSPNATPDELNLNGKNVGFYHFNETNKYSIYWPIWLCFGLTCLTLLLLFIDLAINSAYHFKLTKHKLTYFVNIPITIVLLIMIIFGMIDEPTYRTDTVNGYLVHEWGNLLTVYSCRFVDNQYAYHLLYTKLGVIFAILICIFFFYQIKVTIGLFIESNSKIGSNKHIYIVDNDNNLTIQNHKHSLSRKIKVAKALGSASPFFTLVGCILFYFIFLYSPVLNDTILSSAKNQVVFVIIPIILGVIFLFDLGFSMAFVSRKNFENKNYAIDIGTTIFGSLLSSIASMLVIADFWYSRNIHQDEAVIKNRK